MTTDEKRKAVEELTIKVCSDPSAETILTLRDCCLVALDDLDEMRGCRDHLGDQNDGLQRFIDRAYKENEQLKQDLTRLMASVWPTCPINPQMHRFPCDLCEKDHSNAPGPCNTYLKCWQSWLDKGRS